MTITEAINAIDDIYPNTLSPEHKIRALSELDGKIKQTVIDTHEGGDKISFTPYDHNTPLDTELLTPSPYTSVYLYYLQAEVDLYNGETKRYNNSVTLFNDAFNEFKKYYTRTHRQISAKLKYF